MITYRCDFLLLMFFSFLASCTRKRKRSIDGFCGGGHSGREARRESIHGVDDEMELFERTLSLGGIRFDGHPSSLLSSMSI